MKSLKITFLSLIVVVGASLNSYAQEVSDPQIELQPAQDLGTEAQEVAEIFFNKRINKCVRQLQRSVYDLKLTNVRKQEWSPMTAAYRFEFIKLEGGDMVVGNASMEVNQSTVRGVFGNPVTLYTCKVSN